MLLVTVGTDRLTVYLYIIVPKGFFPQQDTGLIQGNIQAAPNIVLPIVSRADTVHEDHPGGSRGRECRRQSNGTRGNGQFNVDAQAAGRTQSSPPTR